MCGEERFNRKGRKEEGAKNAKQQNLCALQRSPFASFAVNHPFVDTRSRCRLAGLTEDDFKGIVLTYSDSISFSGES
jgi:hypothetical protein